MEDKEQEELIEEQGGEIEEPKEVIGKVIEEIRKKLDNRDALMLKQKEADIKHADKQVTESKERWDNGMADFPEEFETYGDFKRAKEVMEKYDGLLKQIRDELDFLLIILNEQIDKEKKSYMLLSKSSLEIEEILRKELKKEEKTIIKEAGENPNKDKLKHLAEKYHKHIDTIKNILKKGRIWEIIQELKEDMKKI